MPKQTARRTEKTSSKSYEQDPRWQARLFQCELYNALATYCHEQNKPCLSLNSTNFSVPSNSDLAVNQARLEEVMKPSLPADEHSPMLPCHVTLIHLLLATGTDIAPDLLKVQFLTKARLSKKKFIDTLNKPVSSDQVRIVTMTVALNTIRPSHTFAVLKKPNGKAVVFDTYVGGVNPLKNYGMPYKEIMRFLSSFDNAVDPRVEAIAKMVDFVTQQHDKFDVASLVPYWQAAFKGSSLKGFAEREIKPVFSMHTYAAPMKSVECFLEECLSDRAYDATPEMRACIERFKSGGLVKVSGSGATAAQLLLGVCSRNPAAFYAGMQSSGWMSKEARHELVKQADMLIR
jgi:hypothetical protein